MDDRPLFILAGNRSYVNRGCEAIVRGTVKILKESFKDPQFICISHFQNENQFRKQCEEENEDTITHLASITHLPSWGLTKKGAIRSFWKPETWQAVYRYFFDRDTFFEIYRDMLPFLDTASAVLSVGGDNYSLDYGVPASYTALDDLVLAHDKPLAIWGASVGPFSASPEYERYMSDHLRKVTGIFARESATIKYLENIGITRNVYPVADPAFVMEPVEPAGIEESLPIEKGAIGLNLSPLMANYVSRGDIIEWTRIAASIISAVAQTTEMPVYLIPHVTFLDSDDFIFLQKAVSQIPDTNRNIMVVPPVYNAAETKWIISRMAVFAGARTHATIASLSSGVPTLSFAYSIKARGINQDIFGHTQYCMEPEDLDAKTVTDRILSLMDGTAVIKRDLQERIPEVQRSARYAGLELKRILGENTSI